jgi:hypothetical protein
MWFFKFWITFSATAVTAITNPEIIRKVHRSHLDGSLQADVRSETMTSLVNKCVVFHALHKSAGRTLVATLTVEPLAGYPVGTQNTNVRCDEKQLFIARPSCPVPDTLKEPYIGTAGYAHTLSDGQDLFGHANCKYITMFREPISRLVSAYYYCNHGNPGDPLCGSNRLKAGSASIEEWADHWGNYLFRELLLYPPLRKEVMPNGTASCDALCQVRGNESYQGDNFWYKWKIALGEGQDLKSAAGQRNMQLLKQHLLGSDGVQPFYDAVGITTQWENSMKLFDKVAPLHASWKPLSDKYHETHGSGEWVSEERSTLERAMTNQHVLKALEADLKIYNDIVIPLFKQAVMRNGLSASLKLMPDQPEPNLD